MYKSEFKKSEKSTEVSFVLFLHLIDWKNEVKPTFTTCT